MSTGYNPSVRCIFGTCTQPASYRVSRPNVHMPLCPAHQRQLDMEGVPTEPLPPPTLANLPSAGEAAPHP